MAKSFWTPDLRARLIALAAQKLHADAIAEQLGTTRGSILTYAGRHKIVVAIYTPEEQAARDEHERERLREKDKKRTEEKAAAVRRVAAKTAEKRGISKTSADYRNRFLPVQKLSKRELSAMLVEAVQNTARL